MGTELAGTSADVPERFVPETMRGELIEAEHLNRYWWASALAGGRRVLDAGCGLAYGSRILADAGAREVIGVDIAREVIEAAASSHAGVSLEEGDVRALRFADGAFDLVVCFEVIEHVDEQSTVLDELRRVTAPDGILAISSPNRDVYVSGNPHHRHELVPAELEAALQDRFTNVRLLRQHDWLTSAILSDDVFAQEDGVELGAIEVRKVVGHAPGSELYSIGLASNGPIPAPADLAVMTSAEEARRWIRIFEDQDRILRDQKQILEDQEKLLEAHAAQSQAASTRLRELTEHSEHQARTLQEQGRILDERGSLLDRQDLALGELTAQTERLARTIAENALEIRAVRELDRERRELRERLAESERLLARLPDLQMALRAAEGAVEELAAARARAADLEARLAQTTGVLDALVGSRSWRYLRPARAIAEAIRSVRGRSARSGSA